MPCIIQKPIKVIFCKTPQKLLWISSKHYIALLIVLYQQTKNVFYKFVAAWGRDKNIGAWCYFYSVSKFTGNAGNYPICCAGTKTEIGNNIQKLSLRSIKKYLPTLKCINFFYKGTLCLSLYTSISGNKSVIVMKQLGQA